MRCTYVIIALMLSVNAYADYNPNEYQPIPKGRIEAASFPAEDLSQLAPKTISYSWRVEDFTSWGGHEKKMLNLFETFQQKTEFKERMLVMLITKNSAILDKPADKVDLRPFIEVNKIRAVGMKNTALDANQVITYDPNRHWEYRNPPNYHWCDGSSANTACIATDFIIPGNVGVSLRDKWSQPEMKDGSLVEREFKTLIGQSEVRVYSGNEIPNIEDFQKLTKITATKPTGVMVQSGFWFSHAMGFSKTISILQPLPSDPEHKTIVTSFFAFAVEKKYWNAGVNEKATAKEKEAKAESKFEDTGGGFLQGLSRVNGPQGLAAGVPAFTMELTRNSLMMLSR